MGQQSSIETEAQTAGVGPGIGGIDPLLGAARRLRAANIPVMVGQMNEGGGATAAAVHCAMALEPKYCELYGADGIIEDPVRGVTYRNGSVELPRGAGIGVDLDRDTATLLWER